MGIIAFLVLGLLAGLIARAINNGPEPGGLLGTLVVGVVGAILGGLIASAIGIGGLSSFFSIGTWVTAILGALLLLWIYGFVVGGRRSHA
ncbi:GlsB/YeaQ/YmgE family stress response membrane protein [Patulibacter defluvii]|uniref:GlsB/YeaQ/YmgE family stress response membrane protein n=1 Tax=Patulibacter defluvii TaxID=3095358 RepID=UPI002A762AA7|nr:GlsB/YeaQ/YmgE family stress response membrane protein [Patulibacter sp. DM4]